MRHHHGIAKRATLLLLAAVFLFGSFTWVPFAASAATDETSDSIREVLELLTSETYSTYSSLYADKPEGSGEIAIDITNFNGENTTAPYVQLDGFAGSSTPVVVMGSDGKLTWNFEVPVEGKYVIDVEYYTHVTEQDIAAAAEAAGLSESDVMLLVSKTSAIERMLFIDGKVPFSEARSLEFMVSWADEYLLTDKYTTTDGKVYESGDKILSTSDDFFNLTTNSANAKETEPFGPRIFFRDYSEESYDVVSYEKRNEMRPTKIQVSEWRTQALEDSSGYYSEPFELYFTAGEHTLTFESVREPMAIKSITLRPAETAPTYEEYLQMHSDASDVTVDPIVVQAEYSYMTSSQTIYQIADTTSPITQPSDTSRERLNTIGGDKWQYAGDWITWRVEVPQTGFYSIVIRSIQNLYAGTFVSRQLLVNGEVPFREASRLRFNYSSNWQANGLNTGDLDSEGNLITYKVYLEEGVNDITLKVVLGDMGELLGEIQEIMNTVNGYRRRLLMVTGPDPDEYRDYNFDKTMPTVLRGFKSQSERLYAISDELEKIIGEKGDHTVILDKAAWTLERMGTYPTKIASLIDDLKDHIGSLGTWLMDSQNQPLLIDYLSFQSPSAPLPKGDANFWQTVWAEIKKFITSFFSDYDTVGAKTKEEYSDNGAITAWIVTGRDNAKIIRTMINDYFISSTNIPVNLKLVAAGTLLPATLAGTGPDVSFTTASADVINYAIRSAVLSLNQFDNMEAIDEAIYGVSGDALKEAIATDESYYDAPSFTEVMSRFSPSALVPITLYGQTYAVPENQSFFMLFYRKDVLAELGVEVPRTWDAFYDAIYTLQANNLEIGFPTGISGSTILMYQLGETMYKEGNYEEYAEKLMQLYPEERVKELLRDEGIEGYQDMSYMDGLVALNQFHVNSEGEYVPNTDGMEINLGSDVSLACFKQVCELFTMWGFPSVYDFANRFRSGEMPMAVLDYTSYNQLIVFAPEIKGLWEFTTLPGTVIDDKGTINYDSVATVSGIVMMRGVENGDSAAEIALKKKNAWSFMAWWTDSQAQSKYATEMEALLGPSAKQATANLEALYNMPWSTSEYQNLSDQFDNLQATPEYPGSYILARYGSFAFLAVYNDGDEPVETLQGYLDDINKELTRKRQEFGLPVADDFK